MMQKPNNAFSILAPLNFRRVFNAGRGQRSKKILPICFDRTTIGPRRRAFSRPNPESSREFYMRRGRTRSAAPHPRKSPLFSLRWAKKSFCRAWKSYPPSSTRSYFTRQSVKFVLLSRNCPQERVTIFVAIATRQYSSLRGSTHDKLYPSMIKKSFNHLFVYV